MARTEGAKLISDEGKQNQFSDKMAKEKFRLFAHGRGFCSLYQLCRVYQTLRCGLPLRSTPRKGSAPPEEVRNLIGQGETINVEFKGERSGPLSDRDLFVRAEDDGTITGARPRHGDSRAGPLRVGP